MTEVEAERIYLFRQIWIISEAIHFDNIEDGNERSREDEDKRIRKDLKPHQTLFFINITF